jgi:hypothetical protein
MKAIWEWLKTKAWPFIKKHWKGILEALAIIAVAIAVTKILKSAGRGKPISPLPFFPVKGDPHKVLIADPSEQGKWVTVDLGSDTIDDVAAVGLAGVNSRDVVVEVKHAVPDRTH